MSAYPAFAFPLSARIWIDGDVLTRLVALAHHVRSDAVLRGQGSLYIFQILRRREVQLFMFRRCGCYFLLVLVLVLVFISSSSSRVVLHDVFVF